LVTFDPDAEQVSIISAYDVAFWASTAFDAIYTRDKHDNFLQEIALAELGLLWNSPLIMSNIIGDKFRIVKGPPAISPVQAEFRACIAKIAYHGTEKKDTLEYQAGGVPTGRTDRRFTFKADRSNMATPTWTYPPVSMCVGLPKPRQEMLNRRELELISKLQPPTYKRSKTVQELICPWEETADANFRYVMGANVATKAIKIRLEHLRLINHREAMIWEIVQTPQGQHDQDLTEVRRALNPSSPRDRQGIPRAGTASNPLVKMHDALDTVVCANGIGGAGTSDSHEHFIAALDDLGISESCRAVCIAMKEKMRALQSEKEQAQRR